MSSYCVRSDIEQAFGVNNVTIFADLDNDGNSTTIAARIARAIVVASEEIDDAARKGGYRIPLQNEAGTISATVVNLCAVLAGLWMYEARGSKEVDPRSGSQLHQYVFRQTWAARVLEEIRTGKRTIDSAV
jgi:phage gp36-like protein